MAFLFAFVCGGLAVVLVELIKTVSQSPRISSLRVNQLVRHQ
jgi:hypothetical protein